MRMFYDTEPVTGDNYTLFHNSKLSDPRYRVLDPILTVEENKTDRLTFKIPVRNVAYTNMVPLKTFIFIVEADSPNRISYALRVISYTTAADGTKTVTCEGIMSLLCDSYVAPYSYSSIDPTLYWIYMMQAHDTEYSETDDPMHYMHWRTTGYTGTNISRSSQDYVRTLDEINDKIIKLLPCIVRFQIEDTYTSGDTRTTPRLVGTIKDIPEYTSGVTYPSVQYRQNLLDISEEVDGSDFYTAILPLGARDDTTGERLTIESVNSGDPVLHDTTAEATYGVITKILTWDDVTVASNLLTKARSALASQQLVSELTVDAIPAGYLTGEAFEVSDIVHVVRSYLYNGSRGAQGYRYSVDAYVRCTKKTIHYDDHTRDRYRFGTAQQSLTRRLQEGK